MEKIKDLNTVKDNFAEIVDNSFQYDYFENICEIMKDWKRIS